MIVISKTPRFPADKLARAIDAEAADWAAFFDVTDPHAIEARRRMLRANVEVFDYYEPLLPYLGAKS